MNAIVPFFLNSLIYEHFSTDGSKLPSKVQKVVDYLFFHRTDLQGIFDLALAEHIVIKAKPALFSDFARSIQNVLDRISLSRMDQRLQLFLSSVVSLIPYCYPKIGDSFYIPFEIGPSRFERIQFTVHEVLSLTVDASLSPIKAFGLKSLSGHNLLVFLGTTFPSADGFLNSLLADFTPLLSVGKIAFSFSKIKLQEYFTRNKEVIVFGKSLGGSLALHALREYESSIKEVHAVVPAGLHLWDSYKKQSTKKVTIITHAGDLVSKMGYFPEHEKADLYEVSVTSTKITGILAHVIALPGSSCAQVKKIDLKKENRSINRHVMTAFHIAMSFFIFTFLLTTFALHKTRCALQRPKP